MTEGIALGTPGIGALVYWCLEDTIGSMTLVGILLGVWLLLGEGLPACARLLGYAIGTGLAAGELCFRWGIAIPEALLLLVWGIAAFDLSRTGVLFWHDLRNQAIHEDDPRWAKWIVTTAAILLGVLFLGDFIFASLEMRPMATVTWSAWTVGTAVMTAVVYVSSLNLTLFRTIQPYVYRLGLAVLLFTAGMTVLRSGLWFAVAHEILSGAEVAMRNGGTPNLAAMRELAPLARTTNPQDEAARVRNAERILGTEAAIDHLHRYASPNDPWPELIALGGNIVRGRDDVLTIRVDWMQRRFLVLCADGTLLRIGFPPQQRMKTSTVSCWPEPLPENVHTMAMVFVPSAPLDTSDSAAAGNETPTMTRVLGEPAGIWDNVFVLASNGLLANIRENRLGSTQIPLTEGTVCRDLCLTSGNRLWVLLDDGTVLEHKAESNEFDWQIRWPALVNLAQSRVAWSLAPLPDERGTYILDSYGGLHPQGDVPIRHAMLGRHRDTPHYFYPLHLATRLQLADDTGTSILFGDRYGGLHGIALGPHEVSYTGTLAPLDTHGLCRDLQLAPERHDCYISRADGTLLVYPGQAWLKP